MRSPSDTASVPTYRLYRERSGESDDFWIHGETIPARTRLHDWEIALHRHEALFQIFLVTCGSGELLGAGGPRPFTAPCALFIPAAAAHGFRFTRDVDGLVVTARADRLEPIGGSSRPIGAFLRSVGIIRLPPGDADARRLGDALHGIIEELDASRPGRTLALEALAADAVIRLARLGLATHRDQALDRDPGHDRFERLETLIAAHFREQPAAEFFAERLGVTAKHLNRIARRHAGTTVGGLIARRLLDAARRDLAFTPSSVQAIAYALGFSDPAYFNRFFRKHTGMTPGAFRAEQRGHDA